LRGTGIIDVAVSAGGRFGGPGKPAGSDVNAYSDRPFSVVLSATYYDDQRGFDDVEPAYFDDAPAHPYDAINGIDFRDYELHRKRHGYGIDLGFQPNADNSWYARYFDAGYTEKYLRPFLHFTPDGNTVLNADGSITDTLNGAGAIQKDLRDERETSRDRVGYVAPAAAVDLDAATGLLSKKEAMKAIQAAVESPRNKFLAIAVVSRVQAVNARFGYSIGDRVLATFAEHFRGNLGAHDQLFRWEGAAVIAVLEREERLEKVRMEIRRFIEVKLEKTIEVGNRTVLLPISASWSIFPVAPPMDELLKKMEAFVAAQIPRD